VSVPGTLDQALALARTLGVDRLDAQLVLAHCTGRTRTGVMAHGDAPLAEAQAQSVVRALQRRACGEPLAYIVGRRDFHGLELQVGPAVLVPRPDTETLVDWALELLPDHGAHRVVDLGTGSGAIALAVKRARPQASVLATDASADALGVAAGNASRLRLDVQFRVGDWWRAVEGDCFDLALSNPPYIPQDDPHLADLAHEPALALVAGSDGLDSLRRIVAHAPQHLKPGAWLLLEHGHDQGEAVRRLLHESGLHGVLTRRDLAGNERVSGGCRGLDGRAV
jgi:release factor glutamine methyltransferase